MRADSVLPERVPFHPSHGLPEGPALVIATGHELSLAVLDGGVVVRERNVPASSGHAEMLLPAIDALLMPLGGWRWRPRLLIVETGPGSFTGLRIGLAAASGLALAWGVEMRGVRSTQLVAAAVRASGDNRELLVALAAPRGQIWLESFAANGLVSRSAPEALLPAAARTRASGVPLVAGSALPVLGLSGPDAPPRAAAAVAVPAGLFGAAVPLYVRPLHDS